MTLRLRPLLTAVFAALVALVAAAPARAQDAGDDDAGSDADVFDHRTVAYDPQRSMGYGGCAVDAPGDACPAAPWSLALAAAVTLRRRRRSP